MKVYCNNNLIDKDAIAEMFEPGFLFGWGAFETLRAYRAKVPFLDLHIARLNDALNALGIEETKVDFKSKIKELLAANNLEDAYVRITAYKKRESTRSTRPAKNRTRSGLTLSKVEASTGVLIYADKFGYYPQSAYEKGFTAIISPYKRNIKNNFYTIKSLSYLENRLSWFEAQKQKKDEALVLNEDGFLAGGARSNLFIVKNQEVITPSIESGAFAGITRKIVISELKKMNINVKEAQISIEDLASCASEAFLTSALLEVMPLVECDNSPIANKKIGVTTLKILDQYRVLAQ